MRIVILAVLTLLAARSPVRALPGLTGEGATIWNQATPEVPGVPVEEDLLGTVTVSGDFDGDGTEDLATSAPLDGPLAAGSVHVFYGSPDGLTVSGTQLWTEDSPGVPGQEEGDDLFGFALAVGNFDGDAFDDLAIGIAEDPGDPLPRPGAVLVLYGSAGGLTATGAQRLDEATIALNDLARFGDALAAGDFDADGHDDLAVGIPFLTVGGQITAGAAAVFYGSAAGLDSDSPLVLHQDGLGALESAEAVDRFGDALAAGHFDDDAAADLAVAVPHEDFDGITNAGIVHTFYGLAGAHTFTVGPVWDQDVAGINGLAEEGDLFGYALATGELTSTGHDALVVGVYGEAIGTDPNEGAVHVIFGGPTGLTADGSLLYFRGSPSIPPPAAGPSGGRFGSSLVVADFDGDGRGDLAMGAPQQSLPEAPSAGEVVVLYGSEEGLGSAEVWSQESSGVPGDAEDDEYFSWSLGAGDFAGDGADDLAVGVVRDSVGGVRAGSVNVIRGEGPTIFVDGFESGDTSAWDVQVD